MLASREALGRLALGQISATRTTAPVTEQAEPVPGRIFTSAARSVRVIITR